jgi:mannose-6-phosphate isomerase-like protein (cupin superfamily)
MHDQVTPMSDEVWTEEGCYIREIVNRDDQPACSLARARVPAGATTQLHSLSVREWYILLSGNGIATVGSSNDIRASAGDVIEIPPGEPQRIHNPGPGDLIFECLCIPRFTPDCYESLED